MNILLCDILFNVCIRVWVALLIHNLVRVAAARTIVVDFQLPRLVDRAQRSHMSLHVTALVWESETLLAQDQAGVYPGPFSSVLHLHCPGHLRFTLFSTSLPLSMWRMKCPRRGSNAGIRAESFHTEYWMPRTGTQHQVPWYWPHHPTSADTSYKMEASIIYSAELKSWKGLLPHTAARIESVFYSSRLHTLEVSFTPHGCTHWKCSLLLTAAASGSVLYSTRLHALEVSFTPAAVMESDLKFVFNFLIFIWLVIADMRAWLPINFLWKNISKCRCRPFLWYRQCHFTSPILGLM